MRVSPVVSAVVVCLLGADALAQRQLQLLVTATDPSGAEVTTIDPKDVRIIEDGVDGKVLKVEPVDRVPKIQILIDNGVGMPSGRIGVLREGVRGLLEALPPDLEITLVSTSPQPRFLERATKDRQKLLASVDRLVPDTGTGRFVDSLFEATQRVEQDKQQDARYTILTVGTLSGDTIDVRERSVNQIMERIQKRGTTVHVVILAPVGKSAAREFIQEELGRAAASATGGRFENPAVIDLLATLLPEIGAHIGKSVGSGSRQFRITVERPEGKSGDLGNVSLVLEGGRQLTSLTLDQR